MGKQPPPKFRIVSDEKMNVPKIKRKKQQMVITQCTSQHLHLSTIKEASDGEGNKASP